MMLKNKVKNAVNAEIFLASLFGSSVRKGLGEGFSVQALVWGKNMEGVPGHLQSTVAVPLSKAPTPPRACSELVTHSGVYPALRPHATGIGSSALPEREVALKKKKKPKINSTLAGYRYQAPSYRPVIPTCTWTGAVIR